MSFRTFRQRRISLGRRSGIYWILNQVQDDKSNNLFFIFLQKFELEKYKFRNLQLARHRPKARLCQRRDDP